MPQFSRRGRALSAKVVYEGPSGSGKTTNLVALRDLMDPGPRTRILSLETDGDRTLFLDLPPLRLGRTLDYEIRLQIQAVPGRVRHRATRRMVLRGADAVIFVADSSLPAAGDNVAALEDLRANLLEAGEDLGSIPLVFQYNKRDVPGAAPVTDMERALNPHGLPSLPAVAVDGEGVLETLRTATELLLDAILIRHNLRSEASPGAEPTSDLIREVFGRFIVPRPVLVREAVPSWFLSYPCAAPGPGEIEIHGDLDALADRRCAEWGPDPAIPDVGAPPARPLPRPGDSRCQPGASPAPFRKEAALTPSPVRTEEAEIPAEDLLRQALAVCEGERSRGAIDVDTSVDPRLPAPCGEPERLVHLLAEALRTAIHSSPALGTVRVTLCEKQATLRRGGGQGQRARFLCASIRHEESDAATASDRVRQDLTGVRGLLRGLGGELQARRDAQGGTLVQLFFPASAGRVADGDGLRSAS